MHGGDALDEVGRERSAGRGVDEEHVVDRAGGVFLGHVQHVGVPELGLEERALGFLEAEADEDLLDLLEPREIRVRSRPLKIGHGGPHVVGAERDVSPFSRGEQARAEGPHERTAGFGQRQRASLGRGQPPPDRMPLGGHQAAALQLSEDGRIDLLRAGRHLLENLLFRKRTVDIGSGFGPAEGDPVGEVVVPAQVADRGRLFLVREAFGIHLIRGEGTSPTAEREEEATFRESSCPGLLAPSGQLSLDPRVVGRQHEMLGAEAFEAAPESVGRQARALEQRRLFLEHVRCRAQGLEHLALGPGQCQRGRRVDRGGALLVRHGGSQ